MRRTLLWLMAASGVTSTCCQFPAAGIDAVHEYDAGINGPIFGESLDVTAQSAVKAALKVVLSRSTDTAVCIPNPMLVALEIAPRHFTGDLLAVDQTVLAGWAAQFLPDCSQELMSRYFSRLQSAGPPTGSPVLMTISQRRPVSHTQIEALASTLLAGDYILPEFSNDRRHGFWILVTGGAKSSTLHLVSMLNVEGSWEVVGYSSVISIE